MDSKIGPILLKIINKIYENNSLKYKRKGSHEGYPFMKMDIENW